MTRRPQLRHHETDPSEAILAAMGSQPRIGSRPRAIPCGGSRSERDHRARRGDRSSTQPQTLQPQAEMTHDAMPSEQWFPSAAGTAGDFPWWISRRLTGDEATVMVRSLAALCAVLADELELPIGTLPQLLGAAVDDYARPDGPVGPDAFMKSLYTAVHTALG
jgi:hypothetical protein